MNRELQPNEYNIPQNILDKINNNVSRLGNQHVHGLNRAKKLLADKKVKYGQLKRIIHDLQTMDKTKDMQKYELAGGKEMEDWSKQFLQGERDLISDRKDSKMKADSMSSMTGERKNSHLKKHKKRFDFKVPVNLIKSNSRSEEHTSELQSH